MMSKLNYRKRSSPTTGSELLISSAKKLHLDETINNREYLTNLPCSVLVEIMKLLNIDDLVSLSLTCKELSSSALTFLMSPWSVIQTFPVIPLKSFEDMVPTPSQNYLSILGKPFIVNIPEARRAFTQLGLAFKRMTVLMDSRTRVALSCDFLSRLEVELLADKTMVQSRQLAAWCGVFYHKLIQGWDSREIFLSMEVLINHVRKHKLEDILDESFTLGSCPGAEIFYKHLFSYIFYKEVPPDQQDTMLGFLLYWICDEDDAKVAKVLLLMSTQSKEDIGHWQFGIQWNDHTEAIPASLNVATSRYFKLVSLVKLAGRTPLYRTRVPAILRSVFNTSGPWLPENVASVLLMLGPEVTSDYLKSLCGLLCNTCLNKAATAAIVGLSVMTLRFKLSFNDLAFTRFEEVLDWMPSHLQEDLVKAVWKGFSSEFSELTQAANHGEDWAAEVTNMFD